MDTTSVQRSFQKIFGWDATYGCIAANQLDDIISIRKYPLALCVNDMCLPHGGRHWVGLYLESKNAPLEFFCSYGRPLVSYGPHFTGFVMRHRLRVVQKFDVLQSPYTTVCGNYVIFYMLNRYKKISPDRIYAKFSKNVFQNDSFIVSFSKRFHQIKNIK